MPTSETYNIDCMEYMKTLPDKAFDLAVVDPPYGGGFTEGGGCQGWFSKYHQTEHRNLRGRFDRYNDAVFCSQIGNVERERERERERESK